VSDLDVRGYLRSKALDVKAAGKELVVPCFFLCGEPGDSRKKKLYVNAEHGAFSCKVCGTEGGWRRILEHFGDEERADTFKPSRRLQVNAEYVRACQDALMANERALTYLFDRGLTLDTIEAARLGYHPKGTAIVEHLPSALKPGGFTRDELRESGLLTASGRDFHEGRIILPYVVSGQVVQVRGRALDPKAQIKYATPAGDEVRLYNSDALRGADAVIVVEGEIDLLMLQQALQSSPDVRARNLAVVAVPGSQALPGGKEGFGEYFEDIRRVYVGFDSDNAGKQGAIKVKDMLGAKARVVELKGAKDWAELIADGSTWRDVMDLVAEADMRGKRVFSSEESARKLFAIEQGKPGIKTGFASLDAFLAPGLLPGGVTIPLAKTGNGKSIFLANVAYYARHVPTLYITLELTAAETYNRLRRITRFHHPTAGEREVWAQYPLLGLVEDNRLSPEDFERLVEEFAEERGERPQLVFVDHLTYYAHYQKGAGEYEKTTAAVMQLKEEAKRHEVHIIAPSQVNRTKKQGEALELESARNSGAIEETADFALGIWRPHLADDVAGAAQAGAVGDDLNISILKSRHGNQGRIAPLVFSAASLVMVDRADRRNAQRVALENAAINRGEKYQAIYDRDRQRAWADQQGALLPSGKDTASGNC
jgi:KaiC/GvpD/RAD55 family RecA-like ATPase